MLKGSGTTCCICGSFNEEPFYLTIGKKINLSPFCRVCGNYRVQRRERYSGDNIKSDKFRDFLTELLKYFKSKGSRKTVFVRVIQYINYVKNGIDRQQLEDERRNSYHFSKVKKLLGKFLDEMYDNPHYSVPPEKSAYSMAVSHLSTARTLGIISRWKRKRYERKMNHFLGNDV